MSHRGNPHHAGQARFLRYRIGEPAEAGSAGMVKSSDFPQPIGPATITPATCGRPHADGRFFGEVRSEIQPVSISSSVSNPARSASVVVGAPGRAGAAAGEVSVGAIGARAASCSLTNLVALPTAAAGAGSTWAIRISTGPPPPSP